jgi:hypothetical protein
LRNMGARSPVIRNVSHSAEGVVSGRSGRLPGFPCPSRAHDLDRDRLDAFDRDVRGEGSQRREVA